MAELESLLAQLLGRINYERTPQQMRQRKLSLYTMEQLLAKLGNPHHRLPAVHVAGTKGKGSTSWMIANILRCAGFKTGLYTSPHLTRLNERIVVNAQMISDADLCAALNAAMLACSEIDVLAEEAEGTEQRQEEACEDAGGSRGCAELPQLARPTFFEIVTAAALWHFAQVQVDIVVLEVGLGGRLDSTNVCRPWVTVVTSINYDHTRQLGSTLAKIAGEKAGIFKREAIAVSGVTAASPRKVIHQAAAATGAKLYSLDQNFFLDRSDQVNLPAARVHSARPSVEPAQSCGGDTMHGYVAGSTWGTIGEADYRIEDFQLKLLGSHQAQNAAVAVAAAYAVNQRSRERQVDEQSIRSGLLTTELPGRCEVFPASDACDPSKPTVILDIAHNAASIGSFVETIWRFVPQYQLAEKRVLILAVSSDKQYGRMLDLLMPHFNHLILTRFLGNPRSVPPERLARRAEKAAAAQSTPPQIEIAQSPEAAWQSATNNPHPNTLICCTGSVFLIGELRPLVLQWASQNQLKSRSDDKQ